MTLGWPHAEILWCAPAFFPWAVGVVMGTTLLLLGVAAARSLAGGRRAPLRHRIACLGMTGLLVLPILSLSLSWDGPASPRLHWAPPGLADLQGLSWQASPSGGWGIPPGVLLTIWGLGAAALVARLVLDLFLLALWARRGTTSVDRARKGTLRTLARRVGIRRDVRVLYTDVFDIPCTWGVLRPIILLPRASVRWNDDRVRSVLLHELAHIRRHDGLFAILTRMTCAFFWFHPLAWWLERRACDDAERACDSLVIEQGVAPARYARHLLEIIRDARRPPVSVVPTMASESQVVRRISALTDHAPASSRAGRAATAAVLISVLLTTMLLAAGAVPAARSGSPGDNPACSDGLFAIPQEEVPGFENMQSIQPDSIPPVRDW